MRLISTIAALALTAATALAVPALPRPIQVTQPDGTVITVQIRGDERAHCYLSEDGYLLANENGAFYYANVDASGNIVRSSLLASEPSKRKSAEVAYLKTVDMAKVDATMKKKSAESKYNQRPALANVAASPAAAATSSSYGVGLFPDHSFPVTGEQKGIVVLVEYKDVKFDLADPYDYFSRMLNEEGFNDYNGTGSARDYFVDNSLGQFKPQFDVYGPITLSRNRSYYGGNDSNGDDKNAAAMAVEACEQLDAEVDFREYDRDGDGYIDYIYIFYAGVGEATSNEDDSVWPHSWDVRYAGYSGFNAKLFDGKILASYACSNETFYGIPDGIGTFVHEFSHVMGLPDLYATSYTSAFTPGSWSILDQGPYNNNSRTPPAYGAFERNALGWCKPTILSEEGQYEFSHIADSNEAFLIPTSKANEFFLLENRQKSGWDKYIPGHGMLVWHIDYNSSVWTSNVVNNTASHQYVDIEEADDLQTDASRAADAFPGTRNITSFTADTNPGMVTWSGQKINTPITGIKERNGVISFNVGNDGNSGGEEPPVTGDFALNEPGEYDITMTAITISWIPASGATQYVVYVEATDGSYTGRYRYGRNVGNVTTMKITGLAPGTEYSIYVVPIMSNYSEGEPSNTITVSTVADPAGIGSIEIDKDAPAEYYNLQGLQVDPDRLVPGVYIVRQGGKTSKAVIR